MGANTVTDGLDMGKTNEVNRRNQSPSRVHVIWKTDDLVKMSDCSLLHFCLKKIVRLIEQKRRLFGWIRACPRCARAVQIGPRLIYSQTVTGHCSVVLNWSERKVRTESARLTSTQNVRSGNKLEGQDRCWKLKSIEKTIDHRKSTTNGYSIAIFDFVKPFSQNVEGYQAITWTEQNRTKRNTLGESISSFLSTGVRRLNDLKFNRID